MRARRALRRAFIAESGISISLARTVLRERHRCAWVGDSPRILALRQACASQGVGIAKRRATSHRRRQGVGARTYLCSDGCWCARIYASFLRVRFTCYRLRRAHERLAGCRWYRGPVRAVALSTFLEGRKILVVCFQYIFNQLLLLLQNFLNTYVELTNASKLLLLQEELKALAAVDPSIKSDKTNYDNGHSSVLDFPTSYLWVLVCHALTVKYKL